MFYPYNSNTTDTHPLPGFVCAIFIGCIIWGSITASFYTMNRNIRNSHADTTCLLLDYQVTEHVCMTCGLSCSTYKCFDETLKLSYSISNGIYINGTSNSHDRGVQHQQQQVCFLSSVIFLYLSFFAFRLVRTTLVFTI